MEEVDLRHALVRPVIQENFSEGLLVLRAFKQQGGKQSTAYRVLEDMLQYDRPLSEDTVLELVDVLAGWCPQHLRIWKEPLQ